MSSLTSSYPAYIWDSRDYGAGATAGVAYGSYNISALGMPNDSISSIKIAAFTRVMLYEDANFSGASMSIYGPIEIPRLADYNGGFEDRTSSMRVLRIEPTLDTKMNCCQGAGGVCGEYQPSSTQCAAVTADYCITAGHLGEARCKSWCQAHPEQCDAAVVAYCAANPADPFCTCILSPANTKGVANPKCVDKACLDTGYLTTAMRNTNCPPFVDCSVQTTLTNSGVILSNATPIQQNCGITGVTPYVPTPTPTIQTSTAQPSASQLIGQTISKYLLFFILIIAIAILAALTMHAVWPPEE